MRVLVISDKYLSKAQLSSFVDSDLTYFSLTSDKEINDHNKQILIKSSSFTELQSADYINHEIDNLNLQLDEIRVKTSNILYKKQPLIDKFMLDNNISTYYFTNLVEKNVYKYKHYKYIAQYNSIKEILKQNQDINLVLYSLFDPYLKEAICNLDCEIQDITNQKYLSSFKRRFILLKKIIASLINGSLYIFRLLFWICLQKIYIHKGNYKDSNRIKILSYFPLYDENEAEKGRFINSYIEPLQHYLETNKIQYSWLFIYAKIKGKSYLDSLKLSKKIVKSNFLFLESNLTVRIIFQILYDWLSQTYKYICLRKLFFNGKQSKYKSSVEDIYIRDCLDASYFGISVLSGIAYYYIFKSYAQKLESTKIIIYLNEMQTWERSFNAALSKYKPNIRRIGFQHTSVARRIFHYYSEIAAESNSHFQEPLPDYFAVNGSIALKELERSYPKRLILLEALRQINSIDNMQHKNPVGRKKVKQIVVVGSYDSGEAYKILNFILEAFVRSDYKIIVKSHPSCDLSLAVELFRKENDLNIEIGSENLDHYLKESRHVIVGSSTAAIDAIRYRCRVFVPIFPDHIILSPLSGYENLFTYCSKPQDLYQSVIHSDNLDLDDPIIDEMKGFIEKFWLLDPNIPNWKMLLDHIIKEKKEL